MARLNNLVPEVEPKVSDHLPEISALIRTLLDKGHAYESQGDIYFSVPSCPQYGKLSHRKLNDLLAGASERVEEEERQRKRNPGDFALWKKSAEGSVGWSTEFGWGRPGWHIECSAMSMRYLGESFDLHGGGLDLVFPHHENELAQSECATGKPFARLWMHNGFVQVNKEKMGKSLGNFFILREAFDYVEPEAIRYTVLSVHYRSPLNFEWEQDEDGKLLGFPQFADAEERLEYLYNAKQRLNDIADNRVVAGTEPPPPELAEYEARMRQALEDDLNTPVALAHTHALLRHVNELCDRAQGKKGRVFQDWYASALAGLDLMTRCLGIGGEQPAAFLERVRDRRALALGIDNNEVDRQIAARAEARANKDFARSDQIRDELAQKGIELFDSPSGTSWRLARKREVESSRA
jgi:cysteinyl-tRNA synthetase